MEKFTIIELKQVESTNDYLKKINAAEDLNENVVVTTQSQINGKGQGTNSWESQAGKNLTLSILLQPKFLPAEKMFLVSKVVSLGIIDSLNAQGKKFTIKWPNDIYYQDKKVAGILIENQLLGCCISSSIIGIGLNVNQLKFVSDAPNPIALATIFKRSFDLKIVLSDLLNQIQIWYEMLRDGYYDKINDRYFSHLFRNEGYHDFKVEGKIIHASIFDIMEDGQMILRLVNGEKRSFYFKEVEFVI